MNKKYITYLCCLSVLTISLRAFSLQPMTNAQGVVCYFPDGSLKDVIYVHFTSGTIGDIFSFFERTPSINQSKSHMAQANQTNWVKKVLSKDLVTRRDMSIDLLEDNENSLIAVNENLQGDAYRICWKEQTLTAIEHNNLFVIRKKIARREKEQWKVKSLPPIINRTVTALFSKGDSNKISNEIKKSLALGEWSSTEILGKKVEFGCSKNILQHPTGYKGEWYENISWICDGDYLYFYFPKNKSGFRLSHIHTKT